MRKQTDLPASVEIEPKASPIDTYSRPARSELWQVAEGLAKFDSGLDGFLQSRTAKDKQDDALKGEADFHKNNAQGFADAVRDGKIPAFASKSYVDGYKEAEGSVAGYGLQDKYNAAFDAWDGKNSEDPTALSKFNSAFFKANIGTDDPAVLNGLLPHIRVLEAQGVERYTAYRHAATVKESTTAHVAEGVAAATNPTAYGKGYDFDQVDAAREKFISTGGNPDEFDKNMMAAFALKATTGDGDEKALKFFERKVPGQSYTYGDTPDGRVALEQARDKLQTMKHSKLAEDYTVQQRQDKATYDTAVGGMMDILTKDPRGEIPEALYAQAAKHDPIIRTRVAEWRKDLAAGFTSDEDMRGVYAEVMAGRGMAAVHEALQHGVFGRAEDLNAAVAFARGWEGNKERVKDVMGRQTTKNLLQAIKSRTTSENDLWNPVQGLSQAGLRASYDFRRLLQGWVIAHPDADELAIEEAIARTGQAVLDYVTLPTDTTAGTYARPRELDGSFGNPFSGQASAPQGPTPAETSATPSAAPSAPRPHTPYVGGRGPQPPQVEPLGADDQRTFDALQPEQRDKLRDYAKRHGIPLSEAVWRLNIMRRGAAAPEE